MITVDELRSRIAARASLAGVTLARMNLRGLDLGGALLAGAKLTHTDLRGASLVGADLTGAQLGPLRPPRGDPRRRRSPGARSALTCRSKAPR